MNNTYKPKKCNQVVLRADDDLVEKIRFLADYFGVSKTALITELVEKEYLRLTNALTLFV